MTTLHTADVSRRLIDFLDRRQPPRSFAANDSAKRDQITAYVSILTRAAPAAPALDDWWGRFLDALSELSDTWAWPSEKEVRSAVKAANADATRAAAPTGAAVEQLLQLASRTRPAPEVPGPDGPPSTERPVGG